MQINAILLKLTSDLKEISDSGEEILKKGGLDPARRSAGGKNPLDL